MNSKALLRVIEAVLAAILILTVFTVSYYYAAPPNPFTVRAKGDLEKMAYDLLHRLAEEKAFDELLVNTSSSLWRDELTATLRVLLPKNIVYNLTLYNGTKVSDYDSVTIHIYNITGGDVDLYVTSPSGDQYNSTNSNTDSEIVQVLNPEVGDWMVRVEWVSGGSVSYRGIVTGNKTGSLTYITSFSGTLELGGYHEYHFWLYSVRLESIGSITNVEDPSEIVWASEVGEAMLTYTYSTINGDFYTLVLHLTLARVER